MPLEQSFVLKNVLWIIYKLIMCWASYFCVAGWKTLGSCYQMWAQKWRRRRRRPWRTDDFLIFFKMRFCVCWVGWKGIERCYRNGSTNGDGNGGDRDGQLINPRCCYKIVCFCLVGWNPLNVVFEIELKNCDGDDGGDDDSKMVYTKFVPI